MEWLKQNEYITDTGVIGSIAGDISSYSRKLEKDRAIATAFNTLKEYMPSIFQLVLGSVGVVMNTRHIKRKRTGFDTIAS